MNITLTEKERKVLVLHFGALRRLADLAYDSDGVRIPTTEKICETPGWEERENKLRALIETWQPRPRVDTKRIMGFFWRADTEGHIKDYLESKGVEVVEGGELKTREGTK